jgi:hypothetical protein
LVGGVFCGEFPILIVDAIGKSDQHARGRDDCDQKKQDLPFLQVYTHCN